jgi:succinate dehydrogenase / fumarate reductase, iron-sulfur subunit
VKITLKVWRQDARDQDGHFETYEVNDVSPDSSFLEMLDGLNSTLEAAGKEPVAFDSDCREGICGMCGMMINGVAHGPERATTACQLHMRHFNDGDTVTIEPWRAKAFPVVKDLIVDRSSFDRIIQAGGFISAGVGGAPDANATPIPKPNADKAMDAATCIGCGACVAACPNASAMLFTSAKIGHLNLLPQGQPERYTRVSRMVKQMEIEGFGACTNMGECEAVCPKEISMDFISMMNKDRIGAALRGIRD